MRGLILIGTLVLFGYLLEVSHLGDMLNEGWIDSEVRGHGLFGQALFLLVGLVFTGVGLPRQVICFLGGYAFGFVNGSLMGLLATTAGCIVAFYYARWLGRSLVNAKFPDRARKIDAFVHDNPFSMTLLIRLLPVGSNLVTNLAAGVSSVRATPFVTGSAIGFIPQSIVFALIGSGIALDPVQRIGTGVLLFVISGVLGVYLYRRYRHGRHLDDETEHELGEEMDDLIAPNETSRRDT